jgi:hypothetical protein
LQKNKHLLETNTITLVEFIDRAVYFACSTNSKKLQLNKWEEFSKEILRLEEDGDPCVSKE